MEPLLGLRNYLQIKGTFMLSFLLSVVVISLSGVMMPGPLFALTVAKSYKSQFAGVQIAGVQIAAGHALVEIPLILLIYFGLGRFFQHELVQLTLSVPGAVVLLPFPIPVLLWARMTLN